MNDISKEQLRPPSRWVLDCKEHGKQEPEAGTLQQWDEENETIMRELGYVKENEHFCTGDCPHCHSTFQANKVIDISTNPSAELPS